jgi:hypothetical protein
MTSASPEAMIAAFRSHLPSGAKLVTATFGAGTESAAYALGTNRRFVIGPEQLMLSAVTLADGLTGVRADAQVRYVSPRRRSERVPLSARIVQVTKADVGTTPLVSVLVTRRAFVRMLASQVDALPFVGRFSGSFSCPSFGEPIVTFIFRAAPAGPVLARVSESAYTPTDPSPCAATTLTIRGHRLPPLLEGGILLKRAGKLLGVRLTGWRRGSRTRCGWAITLSAGHSRFRVPRLRAARAPSLSWPSCIIGIALADNGNRVIVADSNRFNAAGANAAITIVGARAALARRPAIIATLRAGQFPREVAVEPDGIALISNFASDQLEAINTTDPR